MAEWQDQATRLDGDGDAPPDGSTSPGEKPWEETTQPGTDWPIPHELRVAPFVEDVPGDPDRWRAPRSSEVDRAHERTGVVSDDATSARRRRLVAADADFLATLVLLAALALGAGAWLVLHRQENRPPRSIVHARVTVANKPHVTKRSAVREVRRPATRESTPNLKGATLAAARAGLTRLGLQLRVRRVIEAVPRDTVVSQTPAAGTVIRRGATVVLVLSAGAQRADARIVVPSVVGGEARFAAQTLRAAGFRPTLERIRSPNELTGTVLGQSPEGGRRAPRGSSVRPRIARSAPHAPAAQKVAKTYVPDLVGLQASQAEQRLGALGLHWKLVPVDSSRPKGEVVSQSPDAGAKVRSKEHVVLDLSTGQRLIEVPDVTGLDEDSSRQTLELDGFDVVVVDEPTNDPSQDGFVTDESPVAGTRAAPGTIVTITVARYGG